MTRYRSQAKFGYLLAWGTQVVLALIYLPGPLYDLAARSHYASVWQPITAQVVATSIDSRCEPAYWSSGRRSHRIVLERVSCTEARRLEAAHPDRDWSTVTIPSAQVNVDFAGTRSQHSYDFDEIDWPVRVGDSLPVVVDPANRLNVMPASTGVYVERLQRTLRFLAGFIWWGGVVASLAIFGISRLHEARAKRSEHYRRILEVENERA